MKFSYCSIAFRNYGISLEKIINLVSKAGYDGIEIWANHLNENINLLNLKKTLADANLKVPMISPYFDLTGDENSYQKSLKTAEKFIKIASILESPLLRSFTGTVASAHASKEQWNQCVRGLREICILADKENITIALETHPSTLVDNIDSTISLIHDVGADNLKINLDIYHMFEVYSDPIAVTKKIMPYVKHVHAKNAILTEQQHHQERHPLLHDPNPKNVFTGVKPLEYGEMDYFPFIQFLLNNNYKDFVSVEWFGDNPADAAIEELSFLRKIVSEISNKKISKM